MSRKSRSVNSVDKKLEAVSSTMTADKDPLHHIELELTGTLKQMFEDAGFETVTYSNLIGGVAAIHRGVKPQP